MFFSAFRRRYFWAMVSGLYGCGFLIVLRVAYLGQLPRWFDGIPHYDKPLHLLLYAIATYLGHRLFKGKSWRLKRSSLNKLTQEKLAWEKLTPKRWALPLFPLAFAIFTTIEELAQGLSPNRSLDAIDLICSLVGCWIGYRLAERSIAKIQQ